MSQTENMCSPEQHEQIPTPDGLRAMAQEVIDTGRVEHQMREAAERASAALADAERKHAAAVNLFRRAADLLAAVPSKDL